MRRLLAWPVECFPAPCSHVKRSVAIPFQSYDGRREHTAVFHAIAVKTLKLCGIIATCAHDERPAMIDFHRKVNKFWQRFSKCDPLSDFYGKSERAALENLSERKDIIVKAADKSGVLLVWGADLSQKEALRQLSDTSFYAKVDKDLTSADQQIVKSTINNFIAKQELPATATNIVITTPRTSRIYF